MSGFYSYVLCDPFKKGEFRYDGYDFVFDYEPFYVGKGKGDRAESHLNRAKRNLTGNYNKWLINKIRKIVDQGETPVIIKTRPITEKEAFAKEVFLIAVIGRRNGNHKQGPLVNLTDGGEGPVGFTFSEESRKKASLSQRRRLANETPEEKEKRAAAIKAGIQSPACRLRMSKSQRSRFDNETPEEKEARVSAMKAVRDNDAYRQKRADIMNRRFESDDERKKQSDLIKQVWANFTDDQIQEREIKRQATLADRGEEWMLDMIERRRVSFINRPDAEKEKTRIKRKQTWDNKDPDEVRKIHAQRAASRAATKLAQHQKSLSDDSLREFRRLIKEGEFTISQLSQRFGISIHRGYKISANKERPDIQPYDFTH